MPHNKFFILPMRCCLPSHLARLLVCLLVGREAAAVHSHVDPRLHPAADLVDGGPQRLRVQVHGCMGQGSGWGYGKVTAG